MYKKCLSINNYKIRLRRNQSGSALVMAVFVILIIALLGASLGLLQRNSSTGTSYDIFTKRAYLSAYSGREIASIELQEKATRENRCLNVTRAPVLPQSVGFHGCSVLNECAEVATFENFNVYTIVSKADCKNQAMSVHQEISTTISVAH